MTSWGRWTLLSGIYSSTTENFPGTYTYSSSTPCAGGSGEHRGQLFKLMHQLENTTPHFIRCIKPNTKKLPGIYEETSMLWSYGGCAPFKIWIPYSNDTSRVFWKTAKLEEERNFLEGIIGIQKYFRGYKARCCFQEMREGVTILQSFIPGENIRRKCSCGEEVVMFWSSISC